MNYYSGSRFVSVFNPGTPVRDGATAFHRSQRSPLSLETDRRNIGNALSRRSLDLMAQLFNVDGLLIFSDLERLAESLAAEDHLNLLIRLSGGHLRLAPVAAELHIDARHVDSRRWLHGLS
jgi:hypothetical protein